MYAMVCTRLDISQLVGVLSHYMPNPGRAHWDVVKRVFRYLQGTSEYSICFHGTGNEYSLDIRGYVGSVWASDVDSFLVIALYVDAMLFIGKGKGLITELKSQLLAKFEMKDLGAVRYILGMEIIRDRKNRKLWLGQSMLVIF